MKKIYLLISSFTFSFIGLSQAPIITESNYPIAGESYTGSLAFLPGWTPGSTGSAVTWDFSSLSSGSSSTVNYVDPSGTPYASDFSTSNVVLNQTLVGYFYYNRTSTQVDVTGTVTTSSTPENIRPNSDPQTVITFPFTYLDTFKDTAYTNKISAPSSGTQKRVTYSETLADGYGTLLLPGSPTAISYSNVLRVRITSEVIDSTWDSGNSFTGRSVTSDTQYYFISEDYKPHLLALDKNSSNPGVFIAQYFTPVSATTSILAPAGTYVKLFPNPASTEIHIELDENKISTADLTLQISNSYGQPVTKDKTITSVSQKISCRELNPGFYFYKLKKGDSVLESGKLIIE